MKSLNLTTTIPFDPVRLLVSAEVQYWDDAEINGVQDSEDGVLIPLKSGNLWRPAIELETGRVLNWPQGVTAKIHYKVCDQGEYWLEDKEFRRAKWRGDYVPSDLLSQGKDGFGDYIILDILGDGSIDGWKCPELDAEDWRLVQ